MKKFYLFIIALSFFSPTIYANFSIFARGHKIGTYETFKKGNVYYSISHISINILGFKKSIMDSSHSALNGDYSMKYFDYIHYENGNRREIKGWREGDKIVLKGDMDETLYVKKRKIYTDIGIELFLPKIKKPDSIDVISSGIWQIKRMFLYQKGDTIIISSNGVKFKYFYTDGIFRFMEGPGGLYIGKKKGNMFDKDILNSYRIKAIGVKINKFKRYNKIAIIPPKRYKFPVIPGFQYYKNGTFIIEPKNNKVIKNKSDLTRSTEYYDYDNPIFAKILKRLRGKPVIYLARYVQGIMKAMPIMYPERGSSIFKNRKGDCSEYASLLTTLLRGEGYPAMNVYGLVYMQGFYYYHAWVRVYTEEGWKCVDPTVGEFCDAKYIILQKDKNGGFSTDINFLPVRSLKIMDVR